MKKRTKKLAMKKNAKRLLVFGLFSCAIFTFVLVSVIQVLGQIADKYKEEAILEDKMASLQEEEKNLNNEIKKLQDSEYLARYAREKYFYSKNGELIIRIPEESK